MLRLPSCCVRAYSSRSNMSDSSDDDRVGFVLEHLEDQLKAILEGQAALAGVPGQLQNIDERLGRVEDDVKAIKLAVTDQTNQLNKHETRITDLEQVAA